MHHPPNLPYKTQIVTSSSKDISASRPCSSSGRGLISNLAVLQKVSAAVPRSDHEPHSLGGQPCLETSKGWLPRDCGGSLSTTTCFCLRTPSPPHLRIPAPDANSLSPCQRERKLAALWHLPISLSAWVQLTGSSSRLTSLPPRHLQMQRCCFFIYFNAV